MRSGSIWAVALAATLATACADSADMNDSTATGTATTPAATADPAATAPAARAAGTDDRAFVRKMAEVNIAEARLGELAAERGANAQVKQYGRRMVADHEEANAELKDIAAKMNVELPMEPNEQHRELYDRLSKMKGAEFDREYMQAMVDGHEDAVNDLERHAGPAGDRTVGTTGAGAPMDGSVSAWASKTLVDVRQHLEQARQIHEKLTDR